MGMDVYGKAPTSEVGEYFRNNRRAAMEARSDMSRSQFPLPDSDDHLSDHEDREPEELYCDECGELMFVLDNGVSHHVTESGDIDYDADIDHTAYKREGQ